MTRSPDLRALKDVVKLRTTQQAAAAVRLSAADAEVRRLAELAEEAAARLEGDQVSWAKSMAATPLEIDLALAWSAMVSRREEELRSASFHLDESRAQRARRADAWKTAKARQDCAEDVAGRAARWVSRRKDEAAVAGAADAFLHRQATS